MTIMMHTAMKTEVAALSASVKEATTPVKTFSFDEAQAIAKAGDVIKCTKAVTGDAFFTEGKEYTFFYGEMLFTDGILTVLDNGDIETPADYICPGRIPLLDEFVFVDREDDVPVVTPVVEPAPVAPTFPLSDDRMKDLAIAGIHREIDMLEEAVGNLRENRAMHNSFEGFDVSPAWEDMPDEAKSAVLLAAHNGKPVQFHAPWTFGEEWITFAKGVTPTHFDDKVAYRPAPDAHTIYGEAIAENEERRYELYNELSLLDGSDEELDDDVWFW